MDNSAPKIKIGEEILERIKEKIILGEWKPGDKLPPEKDLMQIFGASRISIREQLKLLNNLGMLETHQGSGTFVRTFNEDSFRTFFIPLFCAQLLSKQDLLYVLELRQMEIMIAGIAAEKSDMEGVAKLQSIYNEYLTGHNDPKVRLYTDLQFHMQISNMTRNPYLIRISRLLYDTLAKALPQFVTLSVKNAIHYHNILIDTISKHYVHEARVAMEKHLKVVWDQVDGLPETAEIFSSNVFLRAEPYKAVKNESGNI